MMCSDNSKGVAVLTIAGIFALVVIFRRLYRKDCTMPCPKSHEAESEEDAMELLAKPNGTMDEANGESLDKADESSDEVHRPGSEADRALSG